MSKSYGMLEWKRQAINQIAFTSFAMGGLSFINTLNPQIHFISGNLFSSVFETVVPQRRQE